MSGIRFLVSALVLVMVLMTAAGKPARGCPPGFHTHRKSCYWFSTKAGSFTYARSICDHLGAYLAIVDNKAEDDFLTAFAKDRGGAAAYFLGGSDLGLEGWWRWEGDEKMEFTNWGENQPQKDEDCMSLFKSDSYLWHDVSCSNSYNWICERAL